MNNRWEHKEINGYTPDGKSSSEESHAVAHSDKKL